MRTDHAGAATGVVYQVAIFDEPLNDMVGTICFLKVCLGLGRAFATAETRRSSQEHHMCTLCTYIASPKFYNLPAVSGKRSLIHQYVIDDALSAQAFHQVDVLEMQHWGPVLDNVDHSMDGFRQVVVGWPLGGWISALRQLPCRSLRI